MLDRFFKIGERNSTFSREILAGVVTFMAMSYILCVQPAIMSGKQFGMNTGMDAAALITTTCLVAAFGSLLMGLWANYPIGLAPGMGENIFVVLAVIPACAGILGQEVGTAAPWQLALGVVLISGILFAILSFLNIRKYLVEAISPSLRGGISAGIGLFIALLGLQHAGVVAVGTRAGLIKENEFPNVERVFATDATATVFGAVLGHSTTTAYVESASGVESGGRTGLAAIVTAICFLVAMFFAPFLLTVAGYQPITAAALVTVGALMLQSATRIDWDDFSESIPAFLLMIGIPLSYSIADGLIVGFIAYPLIKLCSGRGFRISWILYILAVVLIAYLIWIK